MTITNARYPDRDLSDYEADYLFDLHGCLILRGAVGAGQLARINAWVDAQPKDLPVGPKGTGKAFDSLGQQNPQ